MRKSMNARFSGIVCAENNMTAQSAKTVEKMNGALLETVVQSTPAIHDAKSAHVPMSAWWRPKAEAICSWGTMRAI